MGAIRRIVGARWGLLRLAAAALVLWALAGDHAARLARVRLAALPDFDFAAEVATLRAQGRFGEAVMIADAGLALADGPARAALEAERQRTLDEQASWLRKARSMGMGALSGRGDSLEALIGAVTADFFVVGDVRDLVLEGSRLAIDGETDGVILALSGIGLATTLAPEVDWGVSLLKVGRKTGAVGAALGEQIIGLAKRGDAKALRGLASDAAGLAGRTSPATALRTLKGCERAEDAADLAAFAARHAGGGAPLALHVAGPGVLDAIRRGERAESALIAAARKGEAGTSWLRGGAGRALLRPHPLLGLAKAVYKGNAEALIARLAERIDPHGWWMTPLAAAWVVLEVGLLWRRLIPARTVGARTPVLTSAAVAAG